MTHKNLTKKVDRESNIELLRIVLMMMVILHHLLIKSSSSNWSEMALFMSLNTFAIIAVNCFMFISGYYGIKFKIKSLLSFIIQGIFYSVGSYVIFNMIVSTDNYSFIDFIKSFFPITFPVWWFFSAFVGVYVLSPFINKGIEYLKPYQSGGLILFLIYLSCGYPIFGENYYSGAGHGLFTMLLVYIIARYCGKYVKSIKKAGSKYVCVYLFTTISLIALLTIGRNDFAWRIIAYNSPLVILGAIFFFYLFEKIKLKSRIINSIAPLTFGVYLAHENPGSRLFIEKFTIKINETISNPLLMILTLIALVVIIFTTCAIIEKVRQLICNPIVNSIDNKTLPIQLKLKTLLNNLTTH